MKSKFLAHLCIFVSEMRLSYGNTPNRNFHIFWGFFSLSTYFTSHPFLCTWENLELRMSRISTKTEACISLAGAEPLETSFWSRAELMRAAMQFPAAPQQCCFTVELLALNYFSFTPQIMDSCWHLNWHKWPSDDISWHLTWGSEVPTNFLTPS